MDVRRAAAVAARQDRLKADHARGVASPLVRATTHWLPYGALWTDVDLPAGGAFAANLLEQRYDRASRMIGVLPTAKSRAALFWSLRADAFEGWRLAGLDRWKEEVVRLWPAAEALVAQIDRPERLTFARYAHRTLGDPCGAKQVHIGDAEGDMRELQTIALEGDASGFHGRARVGINY